jgi:predicted GNAT superfamily acetyltransferase
VTDFRFRAATQPDLPAILALNHQSEHFLSPLDSAKLARLAKEAAYFLVALSKETVAGFLLGFLPEANYDNPNFLWFKTRYDQFIYIDRVVIAEPFRGRHLATEFYADLEAEAMLRGIPRLACEINIDPPNPISLRFHETQGFLEAGRQSIDDQKKIVSLQTKDLDRNY